MSKVLIVSRTFPAYHPRAGQPTFFVEKFWNSIYADKDDEDALTSHELGGIWSAWCEMRDIGEKHHTIRAGSRWRVGDMFSPRVWSGKPYNSKQIILAPDVEIKKVWDFHFTETDFFINGFRVTIENYKTTMDGVAKNDGLSFADLLAWFQTDKVKNHNKPFQIICWSDSINY